MSGVSETVDIKIREDGSRVVSRDITAMGKAGDVASKSLGLLKTAVAAVVTGAVVNQIRELLDSYTQIQNRLKLTTTDQANLNAVFGELVGISQRTRSSLEANAQLYSKVAINAKELGLSQKDVLQFTESLNKTIKISGASAEEASAGVLQLGQSLASGKLQGDELRSVLENLPAVADVIAKSLGVTRGQLRALGQEGKISAQDIITAFQKARDEIDGKFNKILPTTSEGFVMLKNQLLVTVGAMGDAINASGLLGGGLQDLTNWLKEITPQLVSFVRAIVGSLDPTDELSTGAQLLASAIVVLWGAFKGLTSLLSGVVLIAFKTVGKVVGGVAAAVMAVVNGEFTQAWEIVKAAGTDIVDTYVEESNKAVNGAVDATSEMFTKLGQIWDKNQRMVQDRSKEIVGAVSDVKGPAVKIGPDEKELEKQRKALEKLKNELMGVLNTIAPIPGAQLEMAKATDILNKSQQKGLITKQQEAYYLELLQAHYKDILDPLGKLNREIDQQTMLLGLSSRARAVETQVLDAQKTLLEQGVKLSDDEVKVLRAKYKALQDLNEAVDAQDQLLTGSVEARRAFITQLTAIQTLLADPASGFKKTDAISALSQSMPDLFEGTQEALDAQVARFQLMYQQIDALRQADVISEQTAAQMRAKVAVQQDELRLQNARGFFGDLASLSKIENQKIAAIGKAAAVTQATIDGVLAVQKALASAPPPANYALAAAAGVAAAANVAQILSASTAFATGGQFKVGGTGGTDSQMVAFRATPGEQVAVSTPQQVRHGSGSQGGDAPAPVVHVTPQIINVRDPKEIPTAIQSNEGSAAIINVIEQNRSAIKAVLGG